MCFDLQDDLQLGKFSRDFSGFTNTYQRMLSNAEESSKLEAKARKPMRTYEESDKSKKTVDTMIVRKDSEKDTKKAGKKKNKANKVASKDKEVEETAEVQSKKSQQGMINMNGESAVVTNGVAESLDERTILANREKLFAARGKKPTKAEEAKHSPGDSKKKVKVNRQWELAGKSRDAETLDYSHDKGDVSNSEVDVTSGQSLCGQMVGGLKDIETEDGEISNEEDNETVMDGFAAGNVGHEGCLLYTSDAADE